MQYTEDITGIKINVQAVGITIGDDIKERKRYVNVWRDLVGFMKK